MAILVDEHKSAYRFAHKEFHLLHFESFHGIVSARSSVGSIQSHIGVVIAAYYSMYGMFCILNRDKPRMNTSLNAMWQVSTT